MPAKISVIIPIYNAVHFLMQALDSVFAQDYSAIEIIVVNDGSHAEARKMIEHICGAYLEVTLIHQENRGAALARWAGVEAASGELIVFLDADDVLMPGALTHLASCMQQNPSDICCYGRRTVIDESGAFTGSAVLPRAEDVVSGNVLGTLLKGESLLFIGAVCIRKNALQPHYFKPLTQGEDWVMFCHLASAGEIISAGERIVLGGRRTGDNISDKVFQQPNLLLHTMLDAVFDDEIFENAVGRTRLALYKMQHINRIRSYLTHHYRQQKRWFKAWQQKRAMLRISALPPTDKIRVLHVTKYFYAGGAERLLSSLLQHSDHERFEHIVLSLSNQNERLSRIDHQFSIPYQAIHVGRRGSRLFTYLRCFLFMRSVKADVIKSWLPPANITAGLMGKILRVPVIWGIHDAQHPSQQPRITRMQAPLSRYLPQKIVCCSQAVLRRCQSAGYAKHRLQLIENGVDTAFFKPQPEEGAALRKSLGIPEGALVIGMAAECTPVKRHGYFLHAASKLHKQQSNAHFILCGKYASPDNKWLMQHTKKLGLENCVHVLGVRDDMPAIYSALDINTLTSRSESFGFAVAEAMACKTYNVATAVGVLPQLLKAIGTTIPVTDDPDILIEAWHRAADMSTDQKTQQLQAGQERIISDYAMERMVRQYEILFTAVGSR